MIKKAKLSICQRAILCVLALGVGAAATANATTVFTLDQDACTGGCGTSPFGKITLDQFGTGVNAYVLVTETLSPNENFAGTGAGVSLGFNVANTITIVNLSANFSLDGSQAQGSYKGISNNDFFHAVTCNDPPCHGGNGIAGPLSFEVHSATGVTIASFLSVHGYYFSSDIRGNSGNTGNVGANTAGVEVTPEPASLALTGSGLLALFLFGVKRRIRT